MRVQLADGAKRDFADGLRWYRKRSDQAANHFIEETNNTIAKILKAPARNRQIRPDIRTIRIKRYPYSLIYLIHPDSIIIVAVAHSKRRPGYWSRRLK
jgi:plasmid stabilization system protein ParE